ncbi:hypothetical protein DFP73DRAFT_526661 [Morchella snyderi]|nr:hypothetical protein DFP73DRAFT_526661 [Morchella snyderi]
MHPGITHCHNSVHEDHNMMAAFNLTQWADFGYPETTKSIGPMEERWKDKPYDDKVKDLSSGYSRVKYCRFCLLVVFFLTNTYTSAGEIKVTKQRPHTHLTNIDPDIGKKYFDYEMRKGVYTTASKVYLPPCMASLRMSYLLLNRVALLPTLRVYNVPT